MSWGYKNRQAALIAEVQRWERILEDGSPGRAAEFAAWIKRSPEHLQAYLMHQALKTELKNLDAEHRFDVDDLIARSSGKVTELFSATPTIPARVADRDQRVFWTWIRKTFFIATAATLGLGFLAVSYLGQQNIQDYETGVGEQRRVLLQDGSVVELNTQTHIRVALRRDRRDVDLLSGEAVFSIRRNSRRPFRVHANGHVIEDLGTEFEVYIHPDASTTVAVLEGQVRITSEGVGSVPGLGLGTDPLTNNPASPPAHHHSVSTEVKAGQQVRIARSGDQVTRATVNVSNAAQWREHRLSFEGASLPEVVTELNRYNHRQIILSDDPALGQRRYTVIVDPYDPDSFVEALRGDPGLIVHSDEQQIVIGVREPSREPH